MNRLFKYFAMSYVLISLIIFNGCGKNGKKTELIIYNELDKDSSSYCHNSIAPFGLYLAKKKGEEPFTKLLYYNACTHAPYAISCTSYIEPDDSRFLEVKDIKDDEIALFLYMYIGTEIQGSDYCTWKLAILSEIIVIFKDVSSMVYIYNDQLFFPTW